MRKTKKACVIGYPITHSRSPLIHNYWLRQLGIPGSYEQREVLPEHADAFLSSLPKSEFVGCNVTIPHKETACRIVSNLSAKAKRLNSVNTVYVRNGETCGTSTDGEGFYENIRATIDGFDSHGMDVTVLGAGGSASAIIGELIDRGCKRIHVVNRTHARAEALVDRLGKAVVPASRDELPHLLKSTDLLINTTPQGMGSDASPDIDLATLQATAIVCDIVYVPLKTKLIVQAEAQGLRTVTGLGMLLHQAVAGFEFWFGVRPTVTQDLHDLVARDITATTT
jgi:shikimate dehydrogenase